MGTRMSTIHNLQELSNWRKTLPNTPTMPVMFLGHGSPMNAIEINEFSRQWQSLGSQITQPTAILCISAHWLTQGMTAVTAMQSPRTIHDFGSFPEALFQVQYPVSGNQALIEDTIANVKTTQIQKDTTWGLDHGTWSILVHMFPKGDIPVVQLSIDYSKQAFYHYTLGKELAALRRKGVLIISSGNIVHNLGRIAWDKIDTPHYGYDWAIEADETMQHYLINHNHQALIDWQNQGQAFKLAIPTPDHYYPMLYSLALQEEKDDMTLFNTSTLMGSLSMTSFVLNHAA